MKIDKSGPCAFEGCTSTRIENRTKWLCQEHNYLRKHGESRRDTAMKKQKEYRDRSIAKQKGKGSTPKKTYRISQQTTDEADIKKRLNELKAKIDQKAHDEGKFYCWGCGNGGMWFDKSHIISVRKRKDLELVEENMNLFCRDCHNKWESNDIELMLELLTFEKDMGFIYEYDREVFVKMMYKIKEYHNQCVKYQWVGVTDYIKENLKKITTKSWW